MLLSKGSDQETLEQMYEWSLGRVLKCEHRNSGSEPQDMQRRKDRDKTEAF